jgi:hypothetical protein
VGKQLAGLSYGGYSLARSRMRVREYPESATVDGLFSRALEMERLGKKDAAERLLALAISAEKKRR